MARGKWSEQAILGVVLVLSALLFLACLLMIIIVSPAD